MHNITSKKAAKSVQKGKQTVGKLLNNIARNHSQSTFIPASAVPAAGSLWYAASRARVKL